MHALVETLDNRADQFGTWKWSSTVIDGFAPTLVPRTRRCPNPARQPPNETQCKMGSGMYYKERGRERYLMVEGF